MGLSPRSRVEGLVDVGHLAAVSLGLGQELERQRRLARGGGSHQLAQPPPGQAANAQGAVEGRESGGDMGRATGGGSCRSALGQRSRPEAVMGWSGRRTMMLNLVLKRS
jgi:hypothetical protein